MSQCLKGTDKHLEAGMESLQLKRLRSLALILVRKNRRSTIHMWSFSKCLIFTIDSIVFLSYFVYFCVSPESLIPWCCYYLSPASKKKHMKENLIPKRGRLIKNIRKHQREIIWVHKCVVWVFLLLLLCTLSLSFLLSYSVSKI